MAENFIVRLSGGKNPSTMAAATTSVMTIDDAERGIAPWKYDTESWFETPTMATVPTTTGGNAALPPSSGFNEKKMAKMMKLLKVESLGEKKQEKKKLDEI